MTKQIRKSLYSFGDMEVGHSITRGGTDAEIHAFRGAAHAFGKRHGRVFSVSKLADGVVTCTRLPDANVRDVANSKYNFHRLKPGESVVIEYSHAAQNAAWLYGRRKNIDLSTKRNPDGTLTVSRQH